LVKWVRLTHLGAVCAFGIGRPIIVTTGEQSLDAAVELGLLPQMQRRERDLYDNIRHLLAASERKVPPLENVPNHYLKPKANT